MLRLLGPHLREDNKMLTRGSAVSGPQVSWVVQRPDKHLGVEKTEELSKGKGPGGQESQRSLEGRRGIPRARSGRPCRHSREDPEPDFRTALFTNPTPRTMGKREKLKSQGQKPQKWLQCKRVAFLLGGGRPRPARDGFQGNRIWTKAVLCPPALRAELPSFTLMATVLQVGRRVALSALTEGDTGLCRARK